MYNVVAVFGRFQPCTRAHTYMLDVALTMAQDNYSQSVFVGLSESLDDERNPLTLNQRKTIIQASTGETNNLVFIAAKDPWKFLQNLYTTFKNQAPDWNLQLLCGDDQYVDYVRMTKYNKQPGQFHFGNIEVVNMGKRDGVTGLESVSATKVRHSVKDNDMVAFSQLMSHKLTETSLVLIFEMLRKQLC